MKNPIITIKTLSGEQVSAPLERWVQALILRLPSGELVELMHMVEQAQSPIIALPPGDAIPADPVEWQRKIRGN